MNVISAEQEAKTPILAKEAVVIPHNYVGFVSLRTNLRNKDLSLEGDIREDGRMIQRCFINTDEKGVSEVLISTSDTPKYDGTRCKHQGRNCFD